MFITIKNQNHNRFELIEQRTNEEEEEHFNSTKKKLEEEEELNKERDTSDWIFDCSCEEEDGEGNSFIVAILRLMMMMINNRRVFVLGTRVRHLVGHASSLL